MATYNPLRAFAEAAGASQPLLPQSLGRSDESDRLRIALIVTGALYLLLTIPSFVLGVTSWFLFDDPHIRGARLVLLYVFCVSISILCLLFAVAGFLLLWHTLRRADTSGKVVRAAVILPLADLAFVAFVGCLAWLVSDD